ncbi:hypothetical protein HK107_03350 [Parvularcula sp. ZS-1/3]|uniref:Flagellin n=1 Tax=Parvularcula mediterranea TaxID=2732508 RepID=A0A7Y3RJR2_9PROT|nr:flagellin [Parvularcula mediterranea]NNU15362.1 hypothetical protein [Parvularcula mediterranea]
MLIQSPDAFFQSTFSSRISQLRKDLDRAANEMVTGRKEDSLGAVRGDQQPLLRAQSFLDASESARARLTLLEGRYEVASSSLRTISELSENVALIARGVGEISLGVDADTFAATEAKTALGGIFGALDARFGGRSIFGGDLGTGRVMPSADDFLTTIRAAVTGPVNAVSIEAAIDTVLAPGGAFDTSLYAGGDRIASQQLSDDSSITGLPSAGDEGFRLLFKGLAMIALNEDAPTADQRTLLAGGSDIIQTAREDIITEEAGLGLALSSIEREGERLSRLEGLAISRIESALGRDPFEAASETQSLEARLQAAYTVTSRLSSLRLTNFLR